jgi:hypothetical protein
VASACSSPPALALSCWGLGGGGSGSVASSGAGGSGAGVIERGSGSFNPKVDAILMKQNQLYHQTSRKEQKIQGVTTRIMIFYDKSPHDEDKYHHILQHYMMTKSMSS